MRDLSVAGTFCEEIKLCAVHQASFRGGLGFMRRATTKVIDDRVSETLREPYLYRVGCYRSCVWKEIARVTKKKTIYLLNK